MYKARRLQRLLTKWPANCRQISLRLSHFDFFDKQAETKPVLNKSVGLFRIAQLSSPRGFDAIKESAVKKSKELLEDAARAEAEAKTIELADESFARLREVADLARFVAAYHAEEKYRHAAGEAHSSVSAAIDRLRDDAKLMERLQRAKLSLEDKEARSAAELLLAEFGSDEVFREPKNTTSELHEELYEKLDLAADAARPTSKISYHPNWLMYTVDPYKRFNVEMFLDSAMVKLDPIFYLKPEHLKALKVEEVHRNRAKLDKLEAWRFYASKLPTPNHLGEIASYFSLGDCMRGISKLFESLYGVKLQPSANCDCGELWSSDVVKVDVLSNNDDSIVGHIYCDFYSRKGKPEHDCHLVVEGGRLFSDGSPKRLPKAVVCLSLDPPSESKPTLLDPYSLSGLFHEMGQAVHSVLTDSVYFTTKKSITDYSEVPALLIEHFARDPRVLGTFARHHRTGEAINRKVLDLISKSYKFEQAAQMQLRYDPVADYFSIPRSEEGFINLMYEKGLSYEPSEDQRQAKCYASRLVSRAVASKVWKKLFAEDPFNAKTMKRYRRKATQMGGGDRAAYEDLLGERLNAEEVVRTLVEDFCFNSGFGEVVTRKGTDVYKVEYDVTFVDDDRRYGHYED